MTIITPPNHEWDSFVRAHPRGHVLQLAAWGDQQREFGWTVERVALTENGQIVAGAQILFRRMPLRLGTRAYIPFGCYVTHESQWDALWSAIHQTAKRQRTIFLKIEPGYYMDAPPPDFARWGFKATPRVIQPPRTVMVDIRQDEDAILARMNQGTRRKIRQSLKNGIRYYEASSAEVRLFTDMMQTTSSRNDFLVHEPAYYQRAYDLLVPSGDAALILAEHEGDALAGIFVTGTGHTAQYLYGASSNIKRNLMAAYGVQWAAIQWAKAKNCAWYDMWGIPDEDEATLEAQFQTRDDGLWGVYGFKRGWGGQVVRSAGAWEYVYNPLIYAGFEAMLKWRERKAQREAETHQHRAAENQREEKGEKEA
jgi:peptidoglycan pentaglycine glycine transferase (the first glycine)